MSNSLAVEALEAARLHFGNRHEVARKIDTALSSLQADQTPPSPGAVGTVREAAKNLLPYVRYMLNEGSKHAGYPSTLPSAVAALEAALSTQPDEGDRAFGGAVEASLRLMERLQRADECFEAALAEGWADALANGDIDAIRDLYGRRITYARFEISSLIVSLSALSKARSAGTHLVQEAG